MILLIYWLMCQIVLRTLIEMHLKGKNTLAFEPKIDREEGFQLMPTTFIVEASRKSIAKMIIIDKLHFRFAEGYGF